MVRSRSASACSTGKTARTHQCHPGYHTLSDAVYLVISSVAKHIAESADRQFVTVENTSHAGGGLLSG